MDGVLQQAGGSVGLLDQRLGVAQDSGQETGDRLDHDDGGDLSPVEDVVADAQLSHLDTAGGVVLGHARVDTLVAAAGEDQRVGVGQVLGSALGEDLARGGGDDEDLTSGGGGVHGEHIIEGLAPHVRLHDHAGSTSQGGVVNGAVPVVGVVTKIMHVQVEGAVAGGSPDE